MLRVLAARFADQHYSPYEPMSTASQSVRLQQKKRLHHRVVASRCGPSSLSTPLSTLDRSITNHTSTPTRFHITVTTRIGPLTTVREPRTDN